MTRPADSDKARLMNALCQNLLVGVTGAISASVVPQYILFLRRGLVENVRVILTESAARIVPPFTLRAYSGHPVFMDGFEPIGGYNVPHIELTREADLFVIMPATADILGKAAHGIADDLLSTAIVASPAPVIFVPSMNETMWRNPGVQESVRLVRSHGYHVIEPVTGIEIADLQPNFGVMPSLDLVIGQLAEILKALKVR